MKRFLTLLVSCLLVLSLAMPLIANAEPNNTPPWADLLDEGDTWTEVDGLTLYAEYAALFDEYTYSNPDTEIGDMTYYVYDPTEHGFPKGEKYPVVLWFHGAGNSSLGRNAISGGGASGMASDQHQQELGGMYIVCPLANEETVGNGWFSNYEASVKGILDEVVEREGITGERLLAGTSAGGAMVDKYLEAYSDEISVVFWMSTWLPTPEKVKEYSDKGIIMWFETGAHDEVISNEMSFGGEGNNVAYDGIKNFEYTIFDWIRNGDGTVASLNFGVQQGQHCSCAQANRNFILDDGTPDDPAHPEGLTGFFRDALAKVRARGNSDDDEQTTGATERIPVEVAQGTVIGYKTGNIYRFKGIPYATAERFQSPIALDRFEDGVWLAYSYGPLSPQDNLYIRDDMISVNELMTPAPGMLCNENCQNLNIWSTDLSASKPVIVFIHGGGLTGGGSASIYSQEGDGFVETQEAVFVSINHRLNVVGFMDLSDYGEEYADSGIVGLEDCVVALKWIKDNIASFGGDPNNVTIVGQSGGGVKVTTLACMSDTVDLFDKVFVMSGGYSMNTQEDRRANTVAVIEAMGLSADEVIPTLTGMTYDELNAATKAAGFSTAVGYGTGTFEAPLIDAEGNINKFAAQRKWIIGTTYSEFFDNANPYIYLLDDSAYLPGIDDEAALARIAERYGDKAEAIAEAYKATYPDHQLAEVLFINAMGGGMMGRYGLIREGGVLDALTGAGLEVYNYVVAYKQPWFGGCTMFHSGDISYWFHSLGLSTMDHMIKGDEENAYRVSSQMGSALAAFMANGNPSTDELAWAAYTPDAHNTMVFDVNTACKTDFDIALYDLMLGSN